MKQDNDKEILICSCHSTEHQLLLVYSEDELDGKKYPNVYAHIHLTKLPFWNRLKYGINYIFGRQCRYGAFDEFIFNPEDTTKLKEVVKYLKKTKKLKKNG
jgi:hypothetical protein